MSEWKDYRKRAWKAAVAIGIGLLFLGGMTGCGSDGDMPLEGDKNPYAQYENLYKESPFDFNYAFYYVNHVMGGKFNDERAEIDTFRANPPDGQVYLKKQEQGFIDKVRDKEIPWEITKGNTGVSYKGEISDNQPNGMGMLVDHGQIILGHFKNGTLDGYAQTYKAFDVGESINDNAGRIIEEHRWTFFIIKPKTLVLSGEGYYKEGRKDGDYISYNIGKQTVRMAENFKNLAGKQYDESRKWASASLLAEQKKALENLLTQLSQNIDFSCITYKDDEPNGDGKVFENGKLIFDGKYKDGHKSGSGKSYFSNGNLHYEGNYEEGEYSGDGKEYYPSGKLKYEGEFKAGQYDGKGKFYREDGSLEYDGKWSHGDYAS